MEVNFLGHHILEKGIEADNSKVDKVLSWPISKMATQAHSFISFIQYMVAFLPDLTKLTVVLENLTIKAAKK
jgi:hypothetical protein